MIFASGKGFFHLCCSYFALAALRKGSWRIGMGYVYVGFMKYKKAFITAAAPRQSWEVSESSMSAVGTHSLPAQWSAGTEEQQIRSCEIIDLTHVPRIGARPRNIGSLGVYMCNRDHIGEPSNPWNTSRSSYLSICTFMIHARRGGIFKHEPSTIPICQVGKALLTRV